MENTKDKTILVIGATGFLGMEICRRLTGAKRKVKGLVRTSSDTTKVQALAQMGVETVTGDIKDIRSRNNAFNGIDYIISTASSTLSRQEGDSIETVDHAGQLNVVESAKKAGVKHFVFISFHPMSSEFPLQHAKRKVEEELIQSGIVYTILQPTFFMEVWLSPIVGIDYPNAKATIYGEGKNKICWISLYDVAALAVASLDNPATWNKVFELGRPEALSPLEVVSIFEQHRGIPFIVEHEPVEALLTQKAAAPDSLGQSFAGLMIAYSEEKLIPMEQTLKAIPATLKSVREYASRAL